MSGDGHPIEHVKLKLTLRAKDLLTEEYPVTEAEVYQVKRAWFWEGEINALEGIGRLSFWYPGAQGINQITFTLCEGYCNLLLAGRCIGLPFFVLMRWPPKNRRNRLNTLNDSFLL